MFPQYPIDKVCQVVYKFIFNKQKKVRKYGYNAKMADGTL